MFVIDMKVNEVKGSGSAPLVCEPDGTVHIVDLKGAVCEIEYLRRKIERLEKLVAKLADDASTLEIIQNRLVEVTNENVLKAN